MTEEYKIVEESGPEKGCPTCGIKRKINQMGMTFQALTLTMSKCQRCKYSKNAHIIRAKDEADGVDRPLEDNWQPIEE